MYTKHNIYSLYVWVYAWAMVEDGAGGGVRGFFLRWRLLRGELNHICMHNWLQKRVLYRVWTITKWFSTSFVNVSSRSPLQKDFLRGKIEWKRITGIVIHQRQSLIQQTGAECKKWINLNQNCGELYCFCFWDHWLKRNVFSTRFLLLYRAS